MGNRDLPDIYTLALGPAALGLRYIYQANPSCPCYNLYTHTHTHIYIYIFIYIYIYMYVYIYIYITDPLACYMHQLSVLATYQFKK